MLFGVYVRKVAAAKILEKMRIYTYIVIFVEASRSNFSGEFGNQLSIFRNCIASITTQSTIL